MVGLWDSELGEHLYILWADPVEMSPTATLRISSPDPSEMLMVLGTHYWDVLPYTKLRFTSVELLPVDICSALSNLKEF